LNFLVFTENRRFMLTFFLFSGGFSLTAQGSFTVQAPFTGEGLEGLEAAVPSPGLRGRIQTIKTLTVSPMIFFIILGQMMRGEIFRRTLCFAKSGETS